MRPIHLADGVRLRFPHRGDDFAAGVEIGMIAVLMDIALAEFTRRVASENVGQVRALARRMNYGIVVQEVDDGWSDVSFSYGRKPRLTLVHAAREDA